MRLRHDIAICMFVVNQTGLIESKSNKAAILYSIISFTECILHCSKSKAKHAIKSVSFTVLKANRTKLRSLYSIINLVNEQHLGICHFFSTILQVGVLSNRPQVGTSNCAQLYFFYEIWGRIFLPPIQMDNPGAGTRN
jgi:hypothetical protein